MLSIRHQCGCWSDQIVVNRHASPHKYCMLRLHDSGLIFSLAPIFKDALIRALFEEKEFQILGFPNSKRDKTTNNTNTTNEYASIQFLSWRYIIQKLQKTCSCTLIIGATVRIIG